MTCSRPTRHHDASARAWFHESLGKLHTQIGGLDDALTEHESALELRRAADDKGGQTRSLNALGRAYWRRGEADAAERSFIATLDSARAAEDAAFETFALMNGQAADALNEAIDLFRSLGAVNRAAEAEAELARLDDPQ